MTAGMSLGSVVPPSQVHDLCPATGYKATNVSHISRDSYIQSRYAKILSECWKPDGGGVMGIATACAEAHRRCSRACIQSGSAGFHWIQPCRANLARPCSSHSLGRDGHISISHRTAS